MTESVLRVAPGGEALIAWFGRVPNFHDAELMELKLLSNAESTLLIKAFRITDKVDERGYLVLDKHVMVTLHLEGVSHVALDCFDLPGIIHHLEATSLEDGLQLAWTGSYGVDGVLRAKRLRIELAPITARQGPSAG